MSDPLEHATGLEQREMLAKAAGNDVSYYMLVIVSFLNFLFVFFLN